MQRPIHYIIGDIHGEFDRLVLLHTKIRRFHQSHFSQRLKTIIHLGDYIDRGPDSFSVVEWLIETSNTLEPETTVVNLKGNHEAMMLKSCASGSINDRAYWIRNGGQDTLDSYRVHGYEKPPKTHLDWMAALPSFYLDRNNKIICVHAGLNPNTFPHDGEDYHLWTRSETFFDANFSNNPDIADMKVIHGHTPSATFEPEISDNKQRINIDTGACYGGALTSAIIDNGNLIDFLSV